MRENDPSVRFTLLGYLIHHGAAFFWASLYEKFLAQPNDSAARTLQKTALTSAVACVVDFKFTPRRFTPGYERRLSKPSLFFVYSAFAIGMAAAGIVKHRGERKQ